MVDGQTFLADWEEAAKLPKKLTTAAPHENRKVSDVLADHVESADVIVIAISAISSEIKRDRAAPSSTAQQARCPLPSLS